MVARWVAEVIRDINENHAEYFTVVEGAEPARVRVGQRHGGRYLYTEADDTALNNLDNLPTANWHDWTGAG